MSVFHAPNRVSAAHATWHVYALVCEHWPGHFVVKFGVSTDPFRRFMQLSPGIAFPFVALISQAVSKSAAFRIERKTHKFFADRRTRGEWFAFDMDSKESFKPGLKYQFTEVTGVEMDLLVVAEQQFKEFCKLHDQEVRKPSGVLYRKFRLANQLAA